MQPLDRAAICERQLYFAGLYNVPKIAAFNPWSAIFPWTTLPTASLLDSYSWLERGVENISIPVLHRHAKLSPRVRRIRWYRQACNFPWTTMLHLLHWCNRVKQTLQITHSDRRSTKVHFRPEARMRHYGPYILFLGTFGAAKNISDLLKVKPATLHCSCD